MVVLRLGGELLLGRRHHFVGPRRGQLCRRRRCGLLDRSRLGGELLGCSALRRGELRARLLSDRLLRGADDIDARAVVDRRRWRHVLLDWTLDAEIAKPDKEMDAVRAILATRRNVTRFDATKKNAEREI